MCNHACVCSRSYMYVIFNIREWVPGVCMCGLWHSPPRRSILSAGLFCLASPAYENRQCQVSGNDWPHRSYNTDCFSSLNGPLTERMPNAALLYKNAPCKIPAAIGATNRCLMVDFLKNTTVACGLYLKNFPENRSATLWSERKGLDLIKLSSFANLSLPGLIC